ncbi:ABC transporter family substrate-binding protein [Microbacterium excoecariae]|uniref:ABC transporter family substrate-binding protein n=1 Tax=Microbacterium excoecariae TaxID=2715210 RepID=UPI00140D24CC|nr:ABC transporter family substrate-binding protein [Microbacterium excoecariae]NHI17024.1 ABC transporter family substrate-binding protein [Microbacterium excoecariae]
MKNTKKWLGVAAVAAGFSLVLTSCAGGDASDDTSDAPAENISGADYNPQDRDALQQGGSVVWPITEITPQMNPNQSDGSVDTATLWAWYNPQIILMTPEGEAYKNDAYLDVWDNEVVDGKRVVTFTFTEDAVWNDGTPMGWESIRNLWMASSGQDEAYQPNSTDGYAKIESVEMGDTEKTAIVTFEDEYPWVDGLFWQIMHPDVDTAEEFNEGYLEEPNPDWGAGPYTIGDFDLNGGTVTFVPNDNWWGDEPMLDEFTFRQLDDTAEINAFRNGEIDAARTSTADRLEQVADMDGVVTYRAGRAATNLLELNSEREELADLEVRQAIFMAIDREQITEVMWDGLGYTEEPVGSLNLYTFQEGYEDALSNAGWEFNVEEANAILDEAGWEMGEDGFRSKDGVELGGRLPTFGDDPITEARARVVQQQLAAIGFNMEIDARPASDFSTVLSEKDWDLVMLGFSSSDPYGVAYMCQLYCSDSGLNLSATGTAEIDERIENEVQSLPTQEEQTEAGLALEAEIMAETWGILPLYSGPEIWTVTEGLANLTPETYTGLDLFGLTPVENVGWMAE